MLLREEGDAVIAIGQASHAWISGQLARAWRPRPEPWEAVCLAAEQHDVGMARWDLTPSLNPATGRPHDFLQMPLDVHLGLWHAAPSLLLTQSRYAALLVSLHGSKLYGRRDLATLDPADAVAIRAFLDAQEAFQERLIVELRADRDELREQQALLFLWDGLSLALCEPWEPFELDGWRLEGGRLSPWPFEGDQLVVRCEGRRLEGRYETEPALHAALDAAPVVELEFELRRPGS
jgi:Protein of unknown function (DUF3891)